VWVFLTCSPVNTEGYRLEMASQEGSCETNPWLLLLLLLLLYPSQKFKVRKRVRKYLR
jgi:hypothetical protein